MATSTPNATSAPTTSADLKPGTVRITSPDGKVRIRNLGGGTVPEVVDVSDRVKLKQELAQIEKRLAANDAIDMNTPGYKILAASMPAHERAALQKRAERIRAELIKAD